MTILGLESLKFKKSLKLTVFWLNVVGWAVQAVPLQELGGWHLAAEGVADVFFRQGIWTPNMYGKVIFEREEQKMFSMFWQE